MTFKLSAFGDEIAADLEDQLAVLNRLAIDGLDLRSAWGKNVLRLNNAEAQRVRDLCDAHGITVRCIGSPIGKSPLAAPIAHELAHLERIIEIGQIVGTRNVRIFSFYPPDTSTNAHYDQHVAEAADRLAKLAALAAEAEYILQLENEREIVGDTPERTLALLQAVDSPHLRFIWDPANFVQVGVAGQVDHHWDALAPHLGYIHVKDARLADGAVTPAGEGDGQLRELLTRLAASGYDGVLSLEPHLQVAGRSGGFSGADGMARAVAALRALLAEIR